jgi:S-formylglutathione hydrolase
LSDGFEVLSQQQTFGGVQGFYRHTSAACGGPMKVGVFVPPQAKAGPVPVVYARAGLGCTEETFAAKAGAQRAAAELGLMLVTCDTSARAQRYPGDDENWDFGVSAGFYLDATQAPWSATYKMETYVTRELRAFVEAHFPARAQAQGILGHSMGGHGALTLALRHPALYRSVSAFAPIVAPSEVPWGQKAFAGYLGEDRSAWAAHDACALVRERPLPFELLIDVGTADKFLQRELQPERFEAACAQSGQALRLRRHAGYDHSYWFVSTFIAEHLAHHARALTG